MRVGSNFRGAALVTVLLLSSILLVVSLSLLTRSQLSHDLSSQQSEILLAKNMALSGLRDFRQKCGHDPSFPPPPGEDQDSLGYSETLLSDTGTVLGRYNLSYSLDRINSQNIIVVESIGMVGQSQFVVTACLEYSEGLRWLGLVRGRLL